METAQAILRPRENPKTSYPERPLLPGSTRQPLFRVLTWTEYIKRALFILTSQIAGTGAAGFAQGCSTLWNAEEVEEAIEAADGGTEAILRE
jgi:hypothetical protein